MSMGTATVGQVAPKSAGRRASHLDLLEISEASAAHTCAANQELGSDSSKVCVNGGAIATGHPIGAQGCRIPASLTHEAERRDASKGIAALGSGGVGMAVTVKR